ncbi:MAG: PA14 domain-containing protein [Cytophagales bacterium]|nr:PA14 domain-containing protein [Cytophagales bacterium]
MIIKKILSRFVFLLLLHPALAQDAPHFKSEVFEKATPWSHLDFYNKPENFQFAIVSDRTGGHRAGVFEKAVGKLNLLMPEFVVSVGDLIEGYTKDSLEVNRQWDEFNGFIDQLQPPFFYLPGNHDFSNAMMKNQWLARYGRDYYYFVYKEVLFILMNTNDGDGVTFSNDQVEYVKKVLETHPGVKWTLFFMHHPIWAYEENDKYVEMEKIVGDRPYTVFAGHTHRYLHSIRNNRNHYVLATTGGGSNLLGPKFGEFDHITWVTMADEGPKIVNLGLDALYDHDVSNPQTRELAKSLVESTHFDHLVLTGGSAGEMKRSANGGLLQEASVKLLVNNTSERPVRLKARFFHHHTLSPSLDEVDTLISAGSTYQMNLHVAATRKVALAQAAPLEMMWRLAYETGKNEMPFYLEGSYQVHFQELPKKIQFSSMPIFLKDTKVEIKNPYAGVTLRHTLDGSEPTVNSPVYTGPITIDRTSPLKVRVFDKDGAQSEVFEKTYTKVGLEPPARVKRTQPGLQYAYYEGEFKKLPKFDLLKPVSTGQALSFDLENLPQRENHFAFLFQGYLEVPRDGIYTFYLHSDDGAQFFIADQLVVDNDGSHSARTRTGEIALAKGTHLIRIPYFEDFMGQVLRLGWEGPGFDRQEIPFERFSH